MVIFHSYVCLPEGNNQFAHQLSRDSLDICGVKVGTLELAWPGGLKCMITPWVKTSLNYVGLFYVVPVLNIKNISTHSLVVSVT